jgi:hypothetical protein
LESGGGEGARSKDIIISKEFLKFFLVLVEATHLREDLILNEAPKLDVGDAVIEILIDLREIIFYFFDILVETQRRQ